MESGADRKTVVSKNLRNLSFVFADSLPQIVEYTP
ncbi:hypothetical protein BROSI_A2117 [Candidatus Brocadia sinica JPN1]|uniref:Uncharacterized protein n=1 Tax=Candidatus Brocadia sinica JPN1 TaxID=1197129 RepID=A0ABQ0JY21_9BACT|nr:hypothetical protein BROSI_A2117 [Candidatus Brocadia sinica JPN1]